MNSRLFPLVLLLIHMPDCLTFEYVTLDCYEDSICAVKDSKLTLTCSHSYINFKTVFWFSHKQSKNWRNNNEPEDLTLDSDYSGRVETLRSNYFTTLTISDVRERDSGEYQLMFIMKDGVKRLGSNSVNLTVTDLQVKVNPVSKDSRDQRVELTCDSSCASKVWYHWKRNGQYFRYSASQNILVSISSDSGSYSCSFNDQDFKNPSSSVCLSESGCWDVIYTSRRVCALTGSTVDISSTYSLPSGYSVNKTFWHYVQPGVFMDLREEHRFAGRVEYVENKLRIKELKISDSGEYRFRIISNTTGGQYSGSPGVILTVTDTHVTNSPDMISGGEKVILSCLTKCTLSDKHTYIWYKNGRQVTDGFTKANKLYLDSVSNEELQEFSCAVGAQEKSTALRNTAVVLCVFLTLALIGVLWYRWRRCSFSKTHRVEKEEAQYEKVHINAASSDVTQKADVDNQDIHYSSINFKAKHSSSIQTDEYPQDTTEMEAVQYAAIMFK